MFGALPKAKVPLGDKGHDADRFGDALTGRGIKICVPVEGATRGRDPS